jgi:hypothetical protein
MIGLNYGANRLPLFSEPFPPKHLVLPLLGKSGSVTIFLRHHSLPDERKTFMIRVFGG